jgi:hypothetical protein
MAFLGNIGREKFGKFDGLQISSSSNFPEMPFTCGKSW